MKFIFDLAILLASSVVVGLRVPILGVFLFLVGLFFASQLWKTLLLLGVRAVSTPRIKMIQTLVFSLLLAVCVGLAAGSTEVESKPEITPEELWSGPLFPVYAGLALMASLALIGLIMERRKR